MNGLNRFMEFLLSVVFLCTGLAKIFSYSHKANRSSASSGSAENTGLTGLPYRWAALIGFFETMAALTLLSPAAALPTFAPALIAAMALALLMVFASLYRVRRRQSTAPTLVLFLIALFVIAAHCL